MIYKIKHLQPGFFCSRVVDPSCALPSSINPNTTSRAIHATRPRGHPIACLLSTTLQDDLNDFGIFVCSKDGIELLFRRCAENALRSLCGMVNLKRYIQMVKSATIVEAKNRSTHSRRLKQALSCFKRINQSQVWCITPTLENIHVSRLT